MKKTFLSIILALFAFCGLSQSIKHDSVAIRILDRISDVIGDLQSCSFTLATSSDKKDIDNGMIKHFGVDEVYMVGPDKMLVNIKNQKGHRQYWYNGSQLAYYSYDENNYALVNAPPTIMEMIDTIHADYGIEFPAADFFYPTFTDDIIQNSDQIKYIGQSKINDKECFHILATSKEMNVQIWIANDAFNLPVKLVITYNKKEGQPQYEATLSNWHVNPDLPNAMFNFLPPPGAAKIRMIPKKKS